MNPKDLARLAPDILKQPPERAAAQIDALSPENRVDLVLSLPSGRQRQDLILLASKPEELVTALPPEDLVLTIKDIGDQDAVPLLDLTSNPQLTYLLDLELWVREGMDLNRLSHWLNILFECGDQRALRWVRSVDFELMVLLFERTVLSIDRDSLDNLPDLMAAQLYTPDDTHHLLIKLGADYTLMVQLMDLIYAHELNMFFALMGNLGTTPVAELEELVLKWRNGRLSDRGWPDLDDALELYRPISQAVSRSLRQLPFGLDNPPRYPLQLRFAGRLLAEGIDRLDSEEKRARVASQLANLINRVLIGDGMVPGEPESLVRSAERVKGRLEIGLALLGTQDAQSSADNLCQHPLLHIFQLAHGAIQERVNRTRRLQASSVGGLLPLLRNPLPERIVALTGSRPMFLSKESILPVEFSDPANLAALDRDLDRIEAIGAACQALNLSRSALPDPFPMRSHPESAEGLFLETLLLTTFARTVVGLDSGPAPFPAQRLPDLFGSLPREPDRLEESIQKWLDGLLDSRPAGMKALAADLTRLMTDQILAHKPQGIDPRFVEGLWIKRTG